MPHRLLLLPLALLLPSAAADESLILTSRAEAEHARPAIAAPALRAEAERQMTRGPWSVVYHRPAVKGPEPNEFYSTGPYWWPNPANPRGPYVRRDGERNPDRFVDNDRDMSEMSQAVLTLGMAAYFLREPKYAERASKVISVWFLDPATRMQPHLEWGQAIPGIADRGRGIGIIDSVPLIWAAQGIALLDASGYWSADDAAGARRWFSDYARWLTTSEKGLDEKRAHNNHGTWWAAQVAAFSAFTRDRETRKMVWTLVRDRLIPDQFQTDGSAPREEARTRSLSYSVMNLNGFALLCRMAALDGVSLWPFLQKPVEYLAPYVKNPDTWKKQQITRFDPDGAYFIALAGTGLGRPEYLAFYRGLKRRQTSQEILIEALLAGEGNQTSVTSPRPR